MRDRDQTLTHHAARALALALLAAVACAQAQDDKAKLTVTLDGVALTATLQQQRAAHFEQLHKRLAELAAKEGTEAEAIALLEAEMAYLIQTTPRKADRVRALGVVTLAKWRFDMATADAKDLRRLMALPQPFTWYWPLDDLRRQVLDALAKRLAVDAPLQRVRDVPYTGELLPSPAAMRRCIRARHTVDILRERLDSERTPLADAMVRWAVDRYLALRAAHTDRQAAALDKQYADLLARAQQSASAKDMDTARAVFVAAQKLRPMRSLAFLQKVVAEMQAGAQFDMSQDTRRDAAAMLMAMAELDKDAPDVCMARARILVDAVGVSPAYLERGVENVSWNLANLKPEQDGERKTLFELRARLNARLGRKAKTTADQARAGQVDAQLLAALRDRDLTQAQAAFDKMLADNAWRLKDLQAAVESDQDMLDALRVVNTRGLRDVAAAAPAVDKIQANLRAYQYKTMVALPGGAFKMGSDAALDEKPVHEVTLSPFHIDKTEVTVGEYALFLKELEAGRFTVPEEILRHQRRFEPGHWAAQLADKRMPVCWVDWHQASAYAAWQGKQLPTEAQWEFAARGAAGRTFPWGDARPPASLLNQRAPRAVGTQPFDATPDRVLDLGSNVAEWCRDTYSPVFYRASPANDPVCTQPGEARVVRGGSFASGRVFALRSASRREAAGTVRDGAVGVRCALVD